MGDTTTDNLDQTDEDILTPTVSDDVMNDETSNFDQTDEEIFSPTVSDEAIEAASRQMWSASHITCQLCVTKRGDFGAGSPYC
jgi:hypothetical protein